MNIDCQSGFSIKNSFNVTALSGESAFLPTVQLSVCQDMGGSNANLDNDGAKLQGSTGASQSASGTDFDGIRP